MCYHAIFGLNTLLDTLLAIDPNSTLGALLPAWERFERGHFAGGRSIRTLADFKANYAYVFRLFSTHDFFREYHTMYRNRQQYHAAPSAVDAAAQAVDFLQTLDFVVGEDGHQSVTNLIRGFMQAHPDDLLAVDEEIRAYLIDNKPRMAFKDVSSWANRRQDFDDSDVARYDNTSKENAPPPPAADPHTQHARLTLLLSQLAALHKRGPERTDGRMLCQMRSHLTRVL